VKVLFKEQRKKTHTKKNMQAENKNSKYSRIGENERHGIRKKEMKT